jgi:hypothetical protein
MDNLKSGPKCAGAFPSDANDLPFNPLADFKNADGVLEGKKPLRGGTGIEEEHLAPELVHGLVGVTVDQAVNVFKGLNDPVFDPEGGSPSVDQPDPVTFDFEQAFIGQAMTHFLRVHIAVDGLHRFALKDIENANVGQVAGMQDEITITQVLAENLNQPLAVTAEMGI